MLLGLIFSGGGPGCEQNGLIQGKIIIIAALMDEQGCPWQALIDLAAWVEKGKVLLASSNYQVNVGQVKVGETAGERGGIQPVVHFFANGEKCSHVKAGENVTFTAQAEVLENAGTLTSVEYSFEGETDFPYKGEFQLTDGAKKNCKNRAQLFRAWYLFCSGKSKITEKWK